MVALFEVLDRNGVQYDKQEAEIRHNLLMKGLRRDPSFESDLEKFKRQQGGAEEDAIPIPLKPSKDDFLGPQMRWVVEGLGSPYAQPVIRILFMVLFFVSYLESLPVFGGILSAALDITIAGGRILIKTVQNAIPPLFGIIPLPFMSIVGIAVSAVFGMVLWPIIAIVSFSRQEFTTAIEAFLRVIPPPLGTMIADAFLDANRTVNRLNEKRKKIVADITAGLKAIVDAGSTVGNQAAQGARTLMTRTQEVANQATTAANQATEAASTATEAASTATEAAINRVPDLSQRSDLVNRIRTRKSFAPTLAPTGGRYRLSRKQRNKNKWKTLRKTPKK